MKNSILFVIIAAILMLIPCNTYAQEKASASSASIMPVNSETVAVDDARVKILRSYLNSHNSPLTGNAYDFVKYADKYDLDWRFVAAISGLESTFGQQIPNNTYNAWGWGIYGDNMIYFKSWEDGIKTISQGLRERYIDQWGAKDVYQIGAMYASSPTWAQRVSYFMSNINSYALANPQESLSLSL